MPKSKHPIALAQALYAALQRNCGHLCERIAVSGSVRRGQQLVSDLEILYIPKKDKDPVHFLMKKRDMIVKRRNAKGHHTYGKWNKLMLHRSTGIPIDFFLSTEANWGRDMVIRTGPKLFNIKLMKALQARGMKAHASPRSHAVTGKDGKRIHAPTEEAMFDLVGWPYREPHLRK